MLPTGRGALACRLMAAVLLALLSAATAGGEADSQRTR